jgi:VRR-NUC domain
MSESALVASIRLALGRDSRVVLWRNNTGSALQDFGSGGMRPLKYGLCVGSSDLIGIVAPHGRLIALEVKTASGRVTREQQQFLTLVERMGGVARVVRSVDEAVRAVDDAQVAHASPSAKKTDP